MNRYSQRVGPKGTLTSGYGQATHKQICVNERDIKYSIFYFPKTKQVHVNTSGQVRSDAMRVRPGLAPDYYYYYFF